MQWAEEASASGRQVPHIPCRQVTGSVLIGNARFESERLTDADYGHTMARVAFEIEFTRDAHGDFRRLEAHIRAAIRDALEVHLRHEPSKVSKSRIKRLRELRRPQYRLRMDDYRVYYDVEGEVVTVLGVVSKTASYDWLADNSE